MMTFTDMGVSVDMRVCRTCVLLRGVLPPHPVGPTREAS